MKTYLIIFIFVITDLSCNISSPQEEDEYSEMKLVFIHENETGLYDVITEEQEKLIAIGDTIYTNEMGYPFIRIWADEAKWSPDGKEIVFIKQLVPILQILKS